jgi:D-3-phosphoglycerate dehydrogenase
VIDEVHPKLLEKLEDHSIDYCPHISEKELASKLRDCTILVMRTKLIFTKEWIDLAPNLKVIGRLGSGLDNIDIDHASKKGITCFNAPEGNRNAVAEQTIGMLLSLLANVHKSSREVKNKIWDRSGNSGIELEALTVGIVGFGNVGSQLAKRLKGFECEVLAYDKFITGFGNDHVEEVSLKELQQRADVVSLHVPLNQYSKEMINSEFISAMKKPFYLLNLSRGKVIKTSDVIEGINKGKIIGCALDVLENEKLDNLTPKQQSEFLYLSDNEKVILTPHIGGLTKNSFLKLAEVLSDKINESIKKQPLVN